MNFKNIENKISNCYVTLLLEGREDKATLKYLSLKSKLNFQDVKIVFPYDNRVNRKLFMKIFLKNLGEKGKVSIRNIRRESNDNIKKLLKEKTISEDESKEHEAEVQKKTDENISLIEKILVEKEKEILTL